MDQSIAGLGAMGVLGLGIRAIPRLKPAGQEVPDRSSSKSYSAKQDRFTHVCFCEVQLLAISAAYFAFPNSESARLSGFQPLTLLAAYIRS